MIRFSKADAVRIIIENFNKGFNLRRTIDSINNFGKHQMKWYNYYDNFDSFIGSEYTENPLKVGDRHRTGKIVAKVTEG